MDREHIWDWAKGVSILAVIAIHSFGMSDLAPWEVWFTVIGRQFVNFAVPLFLAISGWFHGRGASRPVGGRLMRLWPPYVLWTAVFVLLFRRPDLTHPGALLADFLGGRGIGGIGYFVIVLTQMVLLMPLIGRIGSVRGHVAVMALLTPVGLALTYGLAGRWAFPWSALPFVVWYPCYHFGYLMGRFPAVAPGPRLRPALLAVALAMVAAAIIEAILLMNYSLALAVSQKKATSLAFSLALFALLLALRGAWSPRPGLLTFAGRNSYFIYLFHLLPLGLAARLARGGGMSMPLPPGPSSSLP
jgi:fucose 4-O-acetylase-like acetyltransferase